MCKFLKFMQEKAFFSNQSGLAGRLLQSWTYDQTLLHLVARHPTTVPGVRNFSACTIRAGSVC